MKIAFTDFWWKFDPFNNFFVDACQALKSEVYVVHPSQADIIFFSCFGNDHKNYSCKKVYYTGESTDPPWEACDFALTFNVEEDENKHFRLPLWMLYIDWFSRGKEYVNPQFMFPPDSLIENRYTKINPSFTCVGVYNGDPQGNRTDFMVKMAKKIPNQVHAFGGMFQKIPYGEDKKCDVVCNYRFNMCFENRSKPGYHTEKLFHAKLCGTIPIYWSAETYGLDFNKDCCLHLNDFESIDHLVDHVLYLDSDEKKYKEKVSNPLFLNSPNLELFNKFMLEKVLC